MLDVIRNNKKFTQGFLVLITLPFAFWGIDSYVRNVDTGSDIATVGSVKITRYELQNALREQQDRMRASLGGQYDPALFETPEIRDVVLNSLITQRLLAQQARDSKLSIGNQQLVEFIAAVPSLQENGKFSGERYAALVAAQGMSKELFEARLRQDMAMQQLMLPITEAGIPGQTVVNRWLATQLEQRVVGDALLVPDAYLDKVKLAEDAVQKYYETNRKQFELPEQVRAEYLVLSRDDLAAGTVVSDADVSNYFQTHIDQYKEGATRRASHILIRADKDAPKAAADAAKAKAEALLAQLRKTPGDFAKLAKANSEDPGSAEKGGDLDWFGRGMMVKAFEDAAFAMKQGEISGVIRSDFGYHIILLTGVRPERVRPLADVKEEIKATIQREAGAKKYAESAEVFGNVVYEQSDSLKPAAEKWKLEPKQTAWLSRTSKLPAPFDNQKLLNALFSDDGLKNKRNTEAVEVTPGTMVSARVLEHKPASLQPLEAVKTQIEKKLRHDAAVVLAIKDGEDKLARLTKGEVINLNWSKGRNVSRSESHELLSGALRAIFKVNTAKLPAYAGIPSPGNGYVLYRISAVNAADATKDDSHRKTLAQQYARLIADEEFSAWMATLRKKYPVEINKTALESKER